uniref:Tumor protein, translationally-controlled 1 n=1 Tax=Lates calcarifer TaxID=8187 RepID=A0A4W6CJY3_LATCA
MIIYKCIISGDEMFSDIYKVTESDFFYEVEGKTIIRTEDLDDSLFGVNETSSVSGVDIVLNHKLQETSFNKKQYTAYIKDYMKAIKAKLEETNPKRVEAFTTGAGSEVKKILGNINNYQVAIQRHGGLLDYREDGITPYMLFFKDGLEVEKCVST